MTFHNRYGITLAADLYEPKDAFRKLVGDSKELMLIPGDLYDRMDIIPFDKIEQFMRANMGA